MKAETLSDGQLSPPFQFPQPLGGVAGLSLGIEVGIMGGGKLAVTGPAVPVGGSEVVFEVVEALEVVEDDVDVAVLEIELMPI